MQKSFEEQMRSYLARSFGSARKLILWLALATGIGVIVGAAASAFGHALIQVNNLRAAYPAITLGLPLGGLAIVYLYRLFRNTGDRGTNMVIASIHSSEHVPLRMAPSIFLSTVITHLFGGSAGREGAAVQLGGSIANKLGKALKLDDNGRRIAVMCGMSAGFSALFGTPLAATIFSMEVVSVGIMHYAALVPCATASLIAYFVAQFLKMPPEVFPIAAVPAMNAPVFFKVVLLAALFGAVSIVFCMAMHSSEHLLRRWMKNAYVRIFAAGLAIVALSALLGTGEYLGSGMGIIEEILHHGHAAKPWTFLLKILFTALTLGAGFKGGEIVPSLTIGAAFGSVMAGVFGLPMELAAACGMAGVFCGVTNCPIASLLISFELFGFEGMPYYLVSVAVSYMLSGYYGLYSAQKIMYSKTDTKFINAKTH